MNTIIYLIRHSVRLKNNLIIENNSKQSSIVLSEKSILSPEGEKRAEILSNEAELQNIDVIYVSNCVRTLQTAKYLMQKQNLSATIDDRLDERRFGKPISLSKKDFINKQYFDENFKTEGGESQKEVRLRMSQALYEIVNNNQGKRIAIFSHGYAITFLLMNWCKLISVDENYVKKITYKNKILINKQLNAPEVFRLEFNDAKDVVDIKNIVFDDLPFMEGSGK